MHLGPESITLLAVFAFVCEAMIGIPPSVALLRHFFSLRLSDPTQCSGCVSFFAVPETAASGIDFSLPSPEARFRERWLYVDVGVPNPLLSHPTSPAVPHAGWDHEVLASPRLAFVWRRFQSLRALNVTAPKVVKEFLQCRIAPLQRHSRRMWDFAGHRDRMRLQEEDLAPEVLRTVLRVLTGDPFPGSLRSNGILLYLCSGRADFVRQMPNFDEWGLRPAGFMGPCENPASVVASPAAHSGPSPGDMAGRRERGS